MTGQHLSGSGGFVLYEKFLRGSSLKDVDPHAFIKKARYPWPGFMAPRAGPFDKLRVSSVLL
jgi:hypothetical protein